MSPDSRIGRGLAEAWEHVVEGWQALRERAGQALTRFTPRHPGGDVESVEDRIARMGTRWALLAAEVIEQDDAVLVRLEAPGLDPGDFDVQVREGVLIVAGEKRVRSEGTRGHYHVLECAYGAFERAVTLPVPVDEGRAKARYAHGVLTVTLPKSQPSGGRRVPIES